MKIAFIYDHKIGSVLTEFFTGSRCYHIGFTDGVHFWDMGKIRRRRYWTGMYDITRVVLIDTPVPITAEYLEDKLDTDYSTYGYIDYLLFAFRKFGHYFGLLQKNKWGVICSDMVYIDLKANGWPVSYIEVPSPADLELSILGRKNALHT